MLFNHADPTQMAVCDFDHEKSWGTVNSECIRLANWFTKERQLEPGDHIALLADNSIEYIEIVLASIIAGLWVTPINSHLLTEEISYIVRDCGAKLVMHDTAHAALLDSEFSKYTVDICNLFAQVNAAEGLDMQFSSSAPTGGTMIYTSGTTGRPKGVKRFKPATIGESLERMKAGARIYGLNGTGPHLITGPLYHAAPMLLALYDMLNGAQLYILKRWDSAAFVDAVSKYGITTTHLVPTMFVRLLGYYQNQVIPNCVDLESWNRQFSSLRLVLHGAAPIARVTKQKMIEWWGPILVEYWGATEGGITTLATSQEWLNHPGTVGKPLANFEVFVGDENGDEIEHPQGLLFCRHRQLAQVFEYHNDPLKTAKSHPKESVFCTGDIGHVDADGFVYLTDRQSNMIISGGVNIYPAEIEQVLMSHSCIEDVAVFGIPNPEWGEEVKGVVQLKKGNLQDERLAQEILDYVGTCIAKYKVPRSLDFVSELPRNPAGKILLRKLREAYL